MFRLNCVFFTVCLLSTAARAAAPQVIGSPFGYWAATVNSGTGGKYRIDVYAGSFATMPSVDEISRATATR